MPDSDPMVTFLEMTGNFRAGNVLVGASLRKMRLLVCQIEVENTFKTSKDKVLLYRQPAYLKCLTYTRDKTFSEDHLVYSRIKRFQVI